ncbi:unnamed protein product, partial [Mesorhabditis belari]|uniref:Uncharacterized protein n=1 Tax=Mesorhabditis belari TaxID=2138241 RepID=A0AAF3J3J3_9BILA
MHLKVCLAFVGLNVVHRIVGLPSYLVPGGNERAKRGLDDFWVECGVDGTITLHLTRFLIYTCVVSSVTTHNPLFISGQLAGAGSITFATPTSLRLRSVNVFTVKLQNPFDNFIRDVSCPKANDEEIDVWNWGTSVLKQENERLKQVNGTLRTLITVGTCTIIVLSLLIIGVIIFRRYQQS